MSEVVESVLNNKITLYSNGMGHFRRVYEIENERKISIPFKSDHIADVLSSLSVFGKVRYKSPPSFTPTNANATSLVIDSNDSLKSLLHELSGSAIKLQRAGDNICGTLLGVDNKQRIVDNQIVFESFVIVLLDEIGIQKYSLDSINNILFTEEAVQAEIKKALQQNFQKIKPDSTFIDLELASLENKKETVVVQYTIPVASWKIRYNIRSDQGNYFLDGTAIIDNNTNEDWNNFVISVVTGNPNSFSTDLAKITVPNRQHINLVENASQGYVHNDHSMLEVAAAPRSHQRSTKSINTNYASPCSTMMMDCEEGGPNIAAYESMGGAAAVSAGADSVDVGDFCIFTCKDKISIASKRSAVVPIFSVQLTSAATVLLYKEEQNARRPFRALKIKNESKSTLGRGEVVIYQDGVFQGKSIIETAKPGEVRMLSHCIENGVKITTKTNPMQTRQTSIQISDGAYVEEIVYTSKTTYEIENRKEEEFKVGIEHKNILQSSNHTISVSSEEINITQTENLDKGQRFYFNLESKQNCSISVTEVITEQQKVEIGNYKILQRVIVDSRHPLLNNPEIKACIEIQESIDEITQEINQANVNINSLNQQAINHRENLKSVNNSANEATIQKWVSKLQEINDQIEIITRDKIPEFQNQNKILNKKLKEALKNLSVSWKV